MEKNLVETLLGAVVLVVAGLFLSFAYTSTSLTTSGGYDLLARFERIDGINVGSDVKLSGIKVGTVVEQKLDPDTFMAVIRMNIDPAVKLPTDTVAQITSEGLLGGQYLALVPGGDDRNIGPGGEIKYTQAPINLMALLGKFIFSAAENSGTKPGEGAGTKPGGKGPVN